MEADKGYQKTIIKISKNIKNLRLEMGWTQEDMLSKGFNYRHYQKLESGNHSPSLFTLYRLAKVFKIKLSDLLN